MKKQFLSVFILVIFSLTTTEAVYASEGSKNDNTLFTYSTINAMGDIASLVDSLKNETIPFLEQQGAQLYALWTPVDFPADAPFLGLGKNELILMLAWPSGVVQAEQLDQKMLKIPRLVSTQTTVYQAIYLSAGLDIPKGQGFYVHRREHYPLASESHVIKISKEAWRTFEPAFNAKVIALLRQTDSTDIAKQLRIAWYDGYQGWNLSREFSRDPESLKRFRERGKLQIEGSGVAIATDRLFED